MGLQPPQGARIPAAVCAEARADRTALVRVRRSLLADLDAVAATLGQAAVDDEGIHQIRRTLKRARAALRLLEDRLGASGYRRANRALRDASRPLGPARDAAVLAATLSRVLRWTRMSRATRAGGRLAAGLEREREHRRGRVQGAVLAASLELVRDVKRRVRDLAGTRLAGRSPLPGIERSYRRVHRAALLAQRFPDDLHLHEWRKQVKYLANQLAIMASPSSATEAVGREWRRLGEVLGDDHDLGVLRARIELNRRQSFDSREIAQLDSLLTRLVERRAKLQRKCWRLHRGFEAGASNPPEHPIARGDPLDP